MDAGAFVQENKRWLLGCAAGAICWLIGSSVIGSVYSTSGIARQIRTQAGAPDPLYDQKAQDAAAAEGEALTAELKRLRGELEFQVDARFRPDGKGMAFDDYLSTVGSQLKQELLQRCGKAEVQLLEFDKAWPTPADSDGIRAVLFGLDLIAETVTRLVTAHGEVRKADPEALGLRSVRVRYDDKQKGRSPVRAAPRNGQPDLRDLLEQETVTFEFNSDSATAYRFLELCRKPGKTLVIDSIKVGLPSTRTGEGVTVKGSLHGTAFKEGP
jgi:hypothetical protein